MAEQTQIGAPSAIEEATDYFANNGGDEAYSFAARFRQEIEDLRDLVSATMGGKAALDDALRETTTALRLLRAIYAVPECGGVIVTHDDATGVKASRLETVDLAPKTALQVEKAIIAAEFWIGRG